MIFLHPTFGLRSLRDAAVLSTLWTQCASGFDAGLFPPFNARKFHFTVFAIWALCAEIHRRREGRLLIAQKNTGHHTPTGITYSQACMYLSKSVSWGGNHRWCQRHASAKNTTLIHHTVKSLPLESLKEQNVVLDKTFEGFALLMREWNKLRSVYLCP